MSRRAFTWAPEKKTMLEARIKRRLKALELSSYSQYCDYLFGPRG
jgi:chemotaxis protein methyltransferase CheR